VKGSLYYYKFLDTKNEYIWECTKFYFDVTLPTRGLFYKGGIIVASNPTNNIDWKGAVPNGAKKIKEKDLILYSYCKYKSQRFFELLIN